jgi:hypothetical protein
MPISDSTRPGLEPFAPFRPRPITDRPYWDQLANDPRLARWREDVTQRCAAAPNTPALPTAADYLAARRYNDRSRTDQAWQSTRLTFSALIFRRCLLGISSSDPDDRLLNWIWAFAHDPTWAVSAHLPGNELPNTDVPTLDLAACEMGAVLAETCEILRPWMDSVSSVLGDGVIRQIDHRIIEPLARGDKPGWTQSDYVNNWAGVCAGTVLCACESLAAQGKPRPEVRRQMLDVLAFFFDRGFTPHGECDEGPGYWNYGVGFAMLGISRLSLDEARNTLPIDRLKQVAGYLGRAHLFGTTFYSANDADLNLAPSSALLWLANLTGDAWLRDWAGSTAPTIKMLCLSLREIDAALQLDPPTSAPTSALIEHNRPSYLPDQQVTIVPIGVRSGQMIAALGGGSNGERHNHNDLGQFLIFLNQELMIPDLGNMHYVTDFFSSKRYTYLVASSRGHCCPIVNHQEQRAGSEAQGRVIDHEEKTGRLSVELGSAYPPEAKLRSWTRSLAPIANGVEIADAFVTSESGVPITHVVWCFAEPKELPGDPDSLVLQIDKLRCQISARPSAWRGVREDPAALRMRQFNDRTLFRLEFDYVTAANGQCALTSTFTA